MDVGAIGGTHALQGEPKYMEDRVVCCALPGRAGALFAAVYDGHVGHAAAEFCQSKLHEALASKLQLAGDVESALQAAFIETNATFLKESGEDKSGTTACAIVRMDGVLYIANAGDSRCVLRSASGVEQLTVDHKPDDKAETTRIEAAGGEVYDFEDGAGARVCGPDGAMLACSRSIGDRPFKMTDPPFVTPEPDTFNRQIAEGDDFVIVASDGVWDVMSNQKACSVVSAALTSGTPQTAAKALCDEALDAGSEDNISAVVVRLN